MKSRHFAIALVCFCIFITSCSTKTVKKDKNVTAGQVKDKAFINEIKRIQKKNKVKITQEQRDSLKSKRNTTKDADELKDVAPADSNDSSNNIPVENETRKSKADDPLDISANLEEITIAADPVEGILVDESIVDDFEEKYAPRTEEETFQATEEAKIIEEMNFKPAEKEDLDDESLLALKEFEELKKLKDIKDLKELAEVKNADKLLKDELTTYDIPIVVNSRVEYFLNYFQGRARKIFAKWLNRSTKYLPMMRKVFKEKGLPLDLTYLAMIESGFNTSAYSKAHAVGAWQFIKSTGKNYKLKINYWVDERRDPEKATIAAANYLTDLYGLFDSWYLAAAAYNAGEGKIARGIKRLKTEDYWEMSRYRYLKRETKNYIPKLLAAILISKDPEKYGFNNIVPMSEYGYETVEINEPTDLEVIAKSAGVSLAKVKELNPELRRWYTPPEVKSYTIKLPVGSKDSFVANYSKLKPTEKIKFLTYRIKHGQTLSHVARKFGTTVSSIMKINNIRSARRVRAGIELIIPIRGGVSVASLKKSYRPKIDRSDLIIVPKGETVSYRVRKNDTLWDIAQRSGVHITDIIKLNNIKNSIIKPGQKLFLYKEPEKVYAKAKAAAPKAAKAEDNGNYHTVKSGDSLWSISKKYDVSIKELRKMNRLSRRSLIKPGQKIIIAYNLAKPASAKSATIASAYQSGNGFITYTVKKGDTLWEIAKKHKMNISEIKSLNNLKSNRIKPGDELKIKVTKT